MLKAIDRFDPGHGVEFVTLAFPTITGEIKRHFRDRWLKDACQCLDPSERLIIYLRFYEEVPQTEIARRLNVSQMKVSRLLRRALEKIRQAFFTDEDRLAM